MEGRRSENYSVYSQLSEETTADLTRRLEAAYAYYAERFKDVYCPIEFPMLVCLFDNREAFVEAGGHATMPGQFMGGHGDDVGARLMMIFHEGNIGAFMSSCPLMYHEGFHQFAAIEISQAGNVNRKWPLWLDEAYATNFNNITWTGDGWVDGHARAEYIDSALELRPAFAPLAELLDVDGQQWHALAAEGGVWRLYMEGWMLVFFLNHADGGAYRDILADYVLKTSTGGDVGPATEAILALESRFFEWLDTRVHLHMTGAKYYEIFTAMATSLLARAHARGQHVASAEEFLAKARADELDLPPLGDDQWLPDSIRQEMLWYLDFVTQSYDPCELTIETDPDGTPRLRVRQPRFGLVLNGAFKLDAAGDVVDVDVTYVACPSLDMLEALHIVGMR